MAETHKEVVKVWIAPGCIVCDSCETDSPEVFDVQEENCVIRPEALDAKFTQPLTPSILTAAEGCPVDVIKFETVEVEGPEPWPDQEEQEAAVGAAVGAGGGSAKASIIPEGPPDPKWASLLETANVSGGRSAGESAAQVRRPARVTADAIASALPADAPADAQAAAMVGSGFARPRPSVVQRIRERAGLISAATEMTRRQFSFIVVGAWGLVALASGIVMAALQSFMVPKVTKEPPSTFRAGRPGDYSEPGVYTKLKNSRKVWIIHLDDGKLIALSTTCTHLGCIPNWLPADGKFKCPCHGSGFYMDGVNFEGPAPRPLERVKISLDGEYVVVDKSKIYRQELGQWKDPESYITV